MRPKPNDLRQHYAEDHWASRDKPIRPDGLIVRWHDEEHQDPSRFDLNHTH